ncbi:MAG: hypothetical protein PHS04_18080 [Tissierellia bacterium]|nr:hypothetical protein [Tissierellia bacterium]
MKNREEILVKTNELNALYRDMNVILAELRRKQQWSDNKFFELIELIEEPICQKLYLGDYGLYVAWGRDEVNVPQFLVFEDNVHFPVNNLDVTPDIYGIGDTSMDAILEYKMCYLEEKFCFYKEH